VIVEFVKYVLSRAKWLKLKLKMTGFTIIINQSYKDIVVRGYVREDELLVSSIYSELNKVKFSSFHKKLYSEYGSKLFIVAESKISKKLVGIDMFYFNPRDFKESTVHEGFIGVLPEAQGQGIATIMRKAAIKHFSNNGLKGISTRISKNNLGSFKSAKKLGFEVVDEYFDETMDEERCYLVLKLNRKQYFVD
jgi:RimJ/RimL family protein N-acetyltransferase